MKREKKSERSTRAEGIRGGGEMRVVTVVGARPQFIKAAVVSRELRKSHTEILVHTGQHYDHNMSEQFFEELHIPRPDYNLGIGGGTHAQMTGRMMEALEPVLERERPDWILVYGDTNSTLAAALTAAKLHVPVCHVEAGVRTHCMTNPEEINRVCTDHISTLLLASTQSGADSAGDENLANRTVLVGDPMFDAFLAYSGRLSLGQVRLRLPDQKVVPVPRDYYYLTCHREENTGGDRELLEIFRAMEQLDAPTVYPVHPRAKSRALRLCRENGFRNLILAEPVGYLESACLVRNAKKIVTDSGGLQREAFFSGVKCVTVLDFVCWPETMVCRRNELAKPLAGDILEKLRSEQEVDPDYLPFGDGHAARRIVAEMERHVENIQKRGVLDAIP